jgi:hypothetical protein
LWHVPDHTDVFKGPASVLPVLVEEIIFHRVNTL